MISTDRLKGSIDQIERVIFFESIFFLLFKNFLNLLKIILLIFYLK